MIKRLIYYNGSQKIRKDSVWGIPFTFKKDEPQLIEEKFVNNLLRKGIYKLVNASHLLYCMRVGITKRKDMVKILIVRSLGGLGDVLMNTPVFRAIKEGLKNCHLTYALPNEYVPVVENNPYLDKVIVYERDKINSDDYDLLIDLTRPCARYEHTHRPKVDLHRTEIFLKESGMDTKNKLPFYKVKDEERDEAKEYLKKRKFIGFQLRSAAEIRNWKLDNFKTLSKMILSKWEDTNIVLFDKDLIVNWLSSRVILFNNRTIRQVAALIEQATAMVTVDSGLMHLAGALKVPQVALFGNIDADCRMKFYPETKVIQLKKQLKCVPCWENYCGDLKCMNLITPEMVMNELEEICE
jgi:heptosyltransferase-2